MTGTSVRRPGNSWLPVKVLAERNVIKDQIVCLKAPVLTTEDLISLLLTNADFWPTVRNPMRTSLMSLFVRVGMAFFLA